MNNDKVSTLAQHMIEMDENAKVWSIVRTVSNVMADNNISYNQFLAAVDIISYYTHCEAELIASEDDANIDLDGEDGEWFTVSAIG